MANEVFAEDNFVSVIVVQANKRGQTYKEIAKTHEYIVVYGKEPEVGLLELEKEANDLPFTDSKGPFDLWELRNRNPKFGRWNRPNLFFPIYVDPLDRDESGYAKVHLAPGQANCVEVLPKNSEGEEGCWRWSKEKLQSVDLTSLTPVVVAKQRRDGGWNIYEKSRKSTTKAKSLWTETEVISEQGTKELGDLDLADYFEHPKPVGLLRKCARLCLEPGDMVLDFFSGSGTTAHAVLELNKEDGGNRKFILVQLPEPCEPDSSAKKAGFETIADICEERVRRVIKKLTDENVDKLDLEADNKQDRGFRVFKLDESNFKTWEAGQAKDAEGLARQLELHVDHVRDGRTEDDLLYEILLKSGFPLTTPVERLTLFGKTVHSVAGGAMLVCLERELTLETIRAIADRKPERVICLDQGFAGNDQLKANSVQTFKTKGVTSFKTV